MGEINKMQIDKIFEMLSWNSDIETQKKGILEAEKITHLSVLLQPIESKSVWENCAKVLVSKNNKELEIYLIDLFKWLQDMNWPGAYIIYDRLQKMPFKFIKFAYKFSLNMAIKTEDRMWRDTLKNFYIEIKNKIN